MSTLQSFDFIEMLYFFICGTVAFAAKYGERFLSGIKERGQAPFRLISIIPQQRVGIENSVFTGKKVVFSTLLKGDNFQSLGPIWNLPFFTGK